MCGPSVWRWAAIQGPGPLYLIGGASSVAHRDVPPPRSAGVKSVAAAHLGFAPHPTWSVGRVPPTETGVGGGCLDPTPRVGRLRPAVRERCIPPRSVAKGGVAGVPGEAVPLRGWPVPEGGVPSPRGADVAVVGRPASRRAVRRGSLPGRRGSDSKGRFPLGDGRWQGTLPERVVPVRKQRGRRPAAKASIPVDAGVAGVSTGKSVRPKVAGPVSRWPAAPPEVRVGSAAPPEVPVGGLPSAIPGPKVSAGGVVLPERRLSANADAASPPKVAVPTPSELSRPVGGTLVAEIAGASKGGRPVADAAASAA